MQQEIKLNGTVLEINRREFLSRILDILERKRTLKAATLLPIPHVRHKKQRYQSLNPLEISLSKEKEIICTYEGIPRIQNRKPARIFSHTEAGWDQDVA